VIRSRLWLSLALALCSIARVAVGSEAAVFCRGGTIRPLEPVGACGPRDRGVATKGDTILWVGCLSHVPPSLIGPGTRHVNLAGRALLPGFVDAHSHMFGDAIDLADLQTRQALVLRNGITSQGELFVNQTILDRLTGFHQAGAIHVRTSLYLRWNNACGDVISDWWKAYRPVHDPRAQLRMPGLKIFADGGSCNDAAISVPYPDGPFGGLYLTAPELVPMIVEANRLGWQVAIHALGDAAREEVLDALAQVHPTHGLPTRVEHDTIMRPEQVPRYEQDRAI